MVVYTYTKRTYAAHAWILAMYNEIIFCVYTLCIGFSILYAYKQGKEFLIALIAIQAILVNIFVIKQITLFSFAATASDALTIGITLSLNILQEFFGRKSAEQALKISFLGMLFYTILSILHLAYQPHPLDTTQAHFIALLQPMPRIIGASFIVYWIVQWLDINLFTILKNKFPHISLTTRSTISIALTQLIDTILFSFLGLYGIVHSLIEIIIVSYSIKLLVLLASTPFTLLAHHIKQTHSHEI